MLSGLSPDPINFAVCQCTGGIPSDKKKTKRPKLFAREVQQRDNANARAFIGPRASLEDLSREEQEREKKDEG